MIAWLEKYIIYILLIVIVLLGVFSAYEMLKNSAMKTQIVSLKDENTSLTNQNKALTANVAACQKNLDDIKILSAKTNKIEDTKQSIDEQINNYKPNVCLPCSEKGDTNGNKEKVNQPKDDLVHTANLIVDNFNSYKL